MKTMTNINNFNNKTIATLIATVTLLGAALPAFAGREGGPGRVVETVLRDRTDQYSMVFRGGEVARIAAIGDGDIDLYIYDENGNEVAHDNDDDGNPVVTWAPRWTGKFTVRVKNAARYAVDYVLVTN